MNTSRLPVAILAGGLATRLGPLTRETPKCLLEIAGQPFIYHQLRQLQGQGVSTVVLCLGYLGERVVETVRNGPGFDIDIQYSFDGPSLRGTAGALKNALPMLSADFFVLYGDSYLECDYQSIQQAYETTGKPALMTVFRNQGCWDTSNVEFQNGSIVAYDKVTRTPAMHYIDYGLSIWNRKTFETIPETGAFDLHSSFQKLLRQGDLAGFEVHERFYEIGSVDGLNETQGRLSTVTGIQSSEVLS